MESQKGFTLIELLVVIAIIGILSSIVLVGMRGATTQAKDARIKSDMNQIRSVAQIFESTNGNFTNLCSDADIVTLQGDITGQGGTSFLCNTSATAYCVEVKLNAASSYWCVDSTLASQGYAADPDCVSVAPADYTCKTD